VRNNSFEFEFKKYYNIIPQSISVLRVLIKEYLKFFEFKI